MIPEARSLLVRTLSALAAGGALAALGLASDAPGLVVIGVGVSALVLWVGLRRPLRAYRAATEALPAELVATLERRIRHYRALSPAQQERFARRVQRLLVTLEFEHVADANDTPELRILAVAGAALLYVGRDDLRFEQHRSVIFYPDAFSDEYAVSHDGKIAGMVHRQGPVLFSERALRQGWDSGHDGHNVSIHEWAHVLDLEDGFADGVPGLAMGSLEGTRALLSDELERVRDGGSALREYAGTNRAELFAVATEVFFERPETLEREHPELYGVLKSWLHVDPAQLLKGEPPAPARSRKERRAAERSAKRAERAERGRQGKQGKRTKKL